MDASIGENAPTHRYRTARRRKSGWSFGNESRGGWDVSLIYDVSRGKIGNESWLNVRGRR